MKGLKSSWRQKVLLVAVSVILSLLIGEFVARALDLDLRLVQKILYTQKAFLPVHRVSADANRLFELIPNSSLDGQGGTHIKEPKYKTIDIHINSLGLRDPERSPAKKEGVSRIVVFGGSNTFGASVNQSDTYPAYLQAMFDQEYPGKVEVWNAGVCAYTMSQDVAYADMIIDRYNPDLLIMQDTNLGRRAFHDKMTFQELKGLFDKNKELFLENIPPLWQKPKAAFINMHYHFVSLSALYRALYIGAYYCFGIFREDPKSPIPIREKYNYLFGFYGQMVNARDFNAFTLRHPDRKILLFYITDLAFQNVRGAVEPRDNLKVLVFDSSGKPSEYRETHPPSYVYALYAQQLYNFLRAHKWFPL